MIEVLLLIKFLQGHELHITKKLFLRKLFQDRFFILSGTKDQTVIEFFDIQFHSILIIVEFLSKFVPLKKDPGGSLWLNLFSDVFVVIVLIDGRRSIECRSAADT